MPGKWVGFESLETMYHVGLKRIQVNIADKLQQVEIFFTENRFVPILKELTVAPVAAIEGLGILGQQSAHHGGNRHLTGSKRKKGHVMLRLT